MYEILKKQKIAEHTYMLQIKAPEISKKLQPGNFIIIRINDKGERIPLTPAEYDKRTITLVFKEVGKTTQELAKLKKRDSLQDVVGPLGNPVEIKKIGNLCLVAGGVGIAPIYNHAKELKKAGNKITIIAGAQSKKLLFWEDKLKKFADHLFICTDDGTKGEKGFVTDVLKKLIRTKKLNFVLAIGPLVMMKAVADLTRSRVRTFVSLNPIMVDGIGMCGSCRVLINNKVKFACVDGPGFDAHTVNFNDLLNRNNRFFEEEEMVCNCKEV